MKQLMQSGEKSLARINVCDIALAIYLCVLYAHQVENTFEMLLRYGSLALVILVYLLVYGRALGVRHEQKLGTGYFAVWACAFMVYGGLSFFWSMDGSAVIKSVTDILKAVLACFAVLPRIRSEKSIRRILGVMLFSLAYMLVILFIRTPSSAWGTERVGLGINQHSNAIGRMANLGLLLCLYFVTTQKKHRPLIILLMAAFAACAVLTGSKNAIFLMIAEVSLYYFLISGKWKRFLVLAVIILGAALLIYLIMTNETLYNLIGNRIERMLSLFIGDAQNVDGSTMERMFFMRTAWDLFRKHPMFGVGLNNFAAYLRSVFYANAKYSHSGFLEILSTLGVTGFVIYYSMYIWSMAMLFGSARKHNRLAAVLFTYAACAFIFDISTISMYFYPSYLPLMLSFSAGRIFHVNRRRKGKAYGLAASIASQV